MICVSLGNIAYDRALEMCREESLVEIRADLMNLSEHQFSRLLDAGAGVVFTFRKQDMNERGREKYYRMALEAGVKYIDIDFFQDGELFKVLLPEIRKSTSGLILSYHNYERTPGKEELKKYLKIFYEEGASLAKIACMVNNDEDNANLLSLYRKSGNKLILGMGSKGLITRIAAIYMGAPFTFAFPEGEEKTAPGQLTKGELEQIFSILGK